MNFAIVDFNSSIPPKQISEKCFKHRLYLALVAGLKELGHQVEYLNLEAWRDLSQLPSGADAYFFWNGQKKHRLDCRESVEKFGKKTICIEHGWFKRFEYYHFSNNGNFGPYAHFAQSLQSGIASKGLLKRMADIVGVPVEQIGQRETAATPVVVDTDKNLEPRKPLKRMTKAGLYEFITANSICSDKDVKALNLMKWVELREEAEKVLAGLLNPAEIEPATVANKKPDDGYVLLMQQVNGDAQQDYDYDAKEWTEQVMALLASQKIHRPVVIRTHPMGITYAVKDYTHARLIRPEIHRAREVSLADDLAGCAFAVTYNSNSAHEAIVMGVPCVVMGPHLAAVDGVTLYNYGESCCNETNLLEADKGWQPNAEAITQYLARLCKRQWSLDEIRGGKVLEQLIAEF